MGLRRHRDVGCIDVKGSCCNRFASKAGLVKVKMQGYHFATVSLGDGSIILPGNWWRIIEGIGPNHNLHMRECVLEFIRANEFPEKPSRQRSAFFCDRLEDVRQFSSLQPIPGIIYAVEAVEPDAPSHVGYFNCLPPLANFEPHELSRQYWRHEFPNGLDNPFRAKETLIASPLRILGRV